MKRSAPSSPSRTLTGAALRQTMDALLRKSSGYQEALAAIAYGEGGSPRVVALKALGLHQEERKPARVIAHIAPAPPT